MSHEIVGVVLAAGSSQRMGSTTKQLLPFGDKTMVATVVQQAEASQLDRVVVVTGADARAVTGSIGARRATIVHNERYEQGNVTSLLRAVDAAGAAEAVLLLLGDMPGVDVAIIDAFVARWRESRPWAAVAVYAGGVPNHPFLLSAAAVAALPQQDGSKLLWSLLVANPPHPVARLEFAREAPIDVDTVADYEVALRQLGHPSHQESSTPHESSSA
jgi:molybdenum cofactor cytidylyltransferase